MATQRAAVDVSPGLDAFAGLAFGASQPELGPGPRAGVKSASGVNELMARFVADHAPPAAARELLRGAALLWHDHHQAAHEIAQADSSREGSLLHAILHRREPDAGNAKYWYHRVGRHATFPRIARRIGALPLTPEQRSQAARWTPDGAWDPFAFVDDCEAARRRGPGDAHYEFLRRIQQIEFEALVEHLLAAR
jgi:hypothetical protein